MVSKFLKILITITLFFLMPALVWAANEKVIFSSDFLSSQEYINSPIQWEILSLGNRDFYQQTDSLLAKSDGDFWLAYPLKFSYRDFDKLSITLATDQPLELKIITNVHTTGVTTYELMRTITPGETFRKIDISLWLPYFKNPVDDVSFRFISKSPANIAIKEIILKKSTPLELLSQAFKEYFQIAPYSSFTVNLFPTPRIFGHSSVIYFLPLILFLFWLLLFNKKWRNQAAVALLILWVVTDLRMAYEFLNYNLADYQNFVKPSMAEKSLRNYDDFYQFADWLKNNVGENEEIKFYNSGSAHFPRLLQYLIYPVKVDSGQGQGKVYVTYNRTDILFQPADRKLYQNGQSLTQAGKILAGYNKNSLIFQEE